MLLLVCCLHLETAFLVCCTASFHAGGHRYVTFAVEVDTERPVLVDKYLDRAVELDVDALRDKDNNVVIAGIMEHIEQAGIHSGDSACSIPTQTLSPEVLKTVREWVINIAKELKVIGLINIQFAVQDNVPYIIEANPRASRCGAGYSKLACMLYTA